MSERNFRKAAALTGSVLALVAPQPATAGEPLDREVAHPLMEQTAAELGATVLGQFREARADDDSSTSTELKQRGRHRIIELVKAVRTEDGNDASYVLKATMKPQPGGQLDPETTSRLEIEAYSENAVLPGTPDGYQGTVYRFGMDKSSDSYCKVKVCSKPADKTVISSWRVSAAYETDLSDTITDPETGEIYSTMEANQMSSTPFPINLGGSGKSTTLYPKVFKSLVADAKQMLKNVQISRPIPNTFEAPSTFNKPE